MYNDYILKVSQITNDSIETTTNKMKRDKIKFKASFKDYYNFRFYELDDSKKRTYLTNGYNELLIKKYNNQDYVHTFSNKEEFNILFNKYLGRKWLINKKMNYKDFIKLVLFKKYVIYKPVDKTQGIGIEKIKVTYPLRNMYNELVNKDYGLIEQFINQHNDLKKFSKSVNTIRISTINDSECNIIYAGLRLGNGLVVDNFHAGGVIATINTDTGIVVTRAVDLNGKKYKYHPTSKKLIKGYKIPYFNKIIKLINEVYNIVPEVKYVAWDVAITNHGPILVEGNAVKPGYTVIQLPYVSVKKGMKYKINKFIKKETI